MQTGSEAGYGGCDGDDVTESLESEITRPPKANSFHLPVVPEPVFSVRLVTLQVV